ncbi:MAG: PKD domain-containing protein [Candidatus Binatia bacterium]
MMHWSPQRVLGLVVLGSLLVVVTRCTRNQDSTSGSVAEREPTPSAFTPRSHLLIEKVEAHGTPDVTPVPEAENVEEAPVDVSADADQTSGGAPLTVAFEAEVTGGPAGLQYRWDFGDKSAPSHQLKVRHTYTSPGQYIATFSVTGPGINESQEMNIEVTEEGFDVEIDADPDIGTAPLTVQFSAVVDEEVPGPVTFQWDFGDSARDVHNPTNHTYPVPGEYTASVVVTNGLGQMARRNVEIQVDARDEGER